MKRLLLISAIFLYSTASKAQVYPAPSNVGLAANLPHTCVMGAPLNPTQPQWYFATDTSTLYVCISNTASYPSNWGSVTGGGGGSGTVTVVGSGSLTSTAVVTGGGTTTIQTPSATSTLDASGNLTLAGKATATTGFASAADGTHPGMVSFVGNTTLPSLTASTVSIVGPPSATPTAWSLQLPTALPTNNHLLGCTVSGTNCLLTDEGAIPVGTVTSIATTSPLAGGTITSTGTLTCTTCTTNASALTSNVVVKGAGGQATQNSSITDNGTTVTSTDTGGYVAPAFVANGSTAGYFQCTQGTANGHATANTITEECPAAVTAYEVLFPGAAATGFRYWTNSAGVVTESIAAGPLTATNCSSSASPAVCGSAAAGSAALPTNAVSSSIVINTTAVTANSQIFVMTDDTLGTKLGVTCNSTVATLVGGLTISARTAGVSFTVANNVAVVTNPLCVSYLVVN